MIGFSGPATQNAAHSRKYGLVLVPVWGIRCFAVLLATVLLAAPLCFGTVTSLRAEEPATAGSGEKAQSAPGGGSGAESNNGSGKSHPNGVKPNGKAKPRTRGGRPRGCPYRDRTLNLLV